MSVLTDFKVSTSGRWTKLVLSYALRGFARCTSLIPIKKRRIVCISHRFPCEYSDSPRYIAERLISEYPGIFEVYWITDNLKKHEYLKASGIKLVRYRSIREFLVSNTSQIHISNLFGPSFY